MRQAIGGIGQEPTQAGPAAGCPGNRPPCDRVSLQPILSSCNNRLASIVSLAELTDTPSRLID